MPPKQPRAIIAHPFSPLLALVPLADTGKFAVIDIADVEAVSKYHWYSVGKYASGNRPGSARRIDLHVFVWLNSGNAPAKTVDHINRDPLDCRRANLRAATRPQSSWNTGKHRTNATGFKGVTKHRRLFFAHIMAHGVSHIRRGFTSAEDAARARDEMAKELHGEFAVLNFPELH